MRGQARLLEDLTALDDLERVRLLFADLETKTEVIDLALSELLRKKAVERLLGSFGALPNLPTNEELEGSYEQNHVLNPPRR